MEIENTLDLDCLIQALENYMDAKAEHDKARGVFMKLEEQKKTLQQIADETKGPERCQKSNPCKYLRMSLNFSDTRRGLVCVLLFNIKTSGECRRYAYYGGDFKKGMLINYCPFCGKKAPTIQEQPRA